MIAATSGFGPQQTDQIPLHLRVLQRRHIHRQWIDSPLHQSLTQPINGSRVARQVVGPVEEQANFEL